MGMRATELFRAAGMCALLASCGGGGGVQSTPTPTVTSPSPSPTPTPTAVNYDTAEYRNSSGPFAHSAISAYDSGASGAGITVGIVDTGIDIDNVEFTGRISSASATFNGESTIQDQEGHGTAVATILAAARNNRRTLGMAWGATIMALRTEDPTDCPADSGCTHTDSAIAAAIDHARVNGAQVINISLGGEGSSTVVRAAVSRATAAGIVIAVATGNDSAAAPDGFAADLANPSISRGLVIIATSNDADGAHSGFANGAQGYETVTLSALGNRVLAQDQNGIQTLWTGTSMSTPQIAGAVALMLDAFPNLSPQQIVSRLLTTAQDAGAAGADDQFGMGILDLAAAFAPAGATTLGNSSTTVSLTQNGTLSSAMGDASGVSPARVVAIDAMGRAYALSVQRSLTPGAVRPVLAGLREGAIHSAAFGLPGFGGTVGFANRSLPAVNRYGEPIAPSGAGAVSGSLSMRLTPGTSASIALRQRLDATSGSGGDFLAARNATDGFGFDAAPNMTVTLSHELGEDWHLSLSGERGGMADRIDSRDAADPRQDSRYRLFSSALGWTGGPLSLMLSGMLLKEPDTLLGARLAPFFGVGGSTTRFADAQATIALPDRWSVELAARRGWTHANNDGNANLRTRAWNVGVTRFGLLSGADRLALRVAQPLRVTGGGVDALLPVAHDCATGQDDWRVARVDLSPRGREIDTELSYSTRLAAGRISLNSYWRREPGNNAWARDDIGGAIRFSAGY